MSLRSRRKKPAQGVSPGIWIGKNAQPAERAKENDPGRELGEAFDAKVHFASAPRAHARGYLLSPAPRAWFHFLRGVPGLTPWAGFFRPLRGLAMPPCALFRCTTANYRFSRVSRLASRVSRLASRISRLASRVSQHPNETPRRIPAGVSRTRAARQLSSGRAPPCTAPAASRRCTRPGRRTAWSAWRRAGRGAGARPLRRGAWAAGRPCSRAWRGW
jgi:hypothetical protein